MTPAEGALRGANRRMYVLIRRKCDSGIALGIPVGGIVAQVFYLFGKGDKTTHICSEQHGCLARVFYSAQHRCSILSTSVLNSTPVPHICSITARTYVLFSERMF